MSIIHFDTTPGLQEVIVQLEDVTADAFACTPEHADALIYVTTIGDVRRRINLSSNIEFDWVDPKSFAPGTWEMSRGASAPFDLNGGFGAAYGPLEGVWTQISTGDVSWGFSTDVPRTETATFPVYIRDNPGTPGPIIDTATWTISITEAYCGGGGGGGCFTGNMRVLMADGREKPIADVFIGEAVMSLNTQTGELVASRVNELMIPRFCDIYELHLSNGKIIETTIEHPFRTVNGKWASIDPLSTYQSRNGTTYRSPANAKLKEGLLLHGAEEHARVIKIVETGRKETVYHLAHVGMHNFFVEGFCVHNIIDQEIK